MSTDMEHRNFVADPGNEASTTNPGQPETRKDYGITDTVEVARPHSRRWFLRAGIGAAGLFLVGGMGAGVAALNQGGDNPGYTDRHTASPSPEASGPSFEKDLTLKQMTLPETLDAPTFAEVTANFGQALEYAINTGDVELIRRLIPGGHTNDLQPGQFEYRAAFIKGFRESSRGTANDDPNNPGDSRYYPWGFKVEMLEQLNHEGDKPTDSDVNGFTVRARITMGDLPALKTEQPDGYVRLERSASLETEIAFTRHAGLNKDGTYIDVPDVDGTGRGWAVSSVGKMYPLPKIMTEGSLPEGFTEVPKLFKDSAF